MRQRTEWTEMLPSREHNLGCEPGLSLHGIAPRRASGEGRGGFWHWRLAVLWAAGKHSSACGTRLLPAVLERESAGTQLPWLQMLESFTTKLLKHLLENIEAKGKEPKVYSCFVFNWKFPQCIQEVSDCCWTNLHCTQVPLHAGSSAQAAQNHHPDIRNG